MCATFPKSPGRNFPSLTTASSVSATPCYGSTGYRSPIMCLLSTGSAELPDTRFGELLFAVMIAVLVVAVRTPIRSQIEVHHSRQMPPLLAVGTGSGRHRFISDVVTGVEKSAVPPDVSRQELQVQTSVGQAAPICPGNSPNQSPDSPERGSLPFRDVVVEAPASDSLSPSSRLRSMRIATSRCRRQKTPA